MRPDIVVESKQAENFTRYNIIIIDTKWKNLDSSAPDKNYFIDIAEITNSDARIKNHKQIDIAKLKQSPARPYDDFAPIFVRY